MWFEYTLIVVLTMIAIHFIVKYLTVSQELLVVRQELNNQSLDYYLKRVKELGYDFTIKAGPGLKRAKSNTKSTASKAKSKKTKSMKDLIKG